MDNKSVMFNMAMITLVAISWLMALTMTTERTAMEKELIECNATAWRWFDSAQDYNPYTKDMCSWKLHNDGLPKIMKIMVVNVTMYGIPRCEGMKLACRDPCWWDDRSISCNCDVRYLADRTEIWGADWDA